MALKPDTTIEARCLECGQPVRGEALGGFCPRCLSRLAFGPDAETGGSANVVTRSVGDYECLEEIGRGGMGVVWKARQCSLNRVVALKFILAGSFASREFIGRFRAEAAAVARLKHPNIVAVHEVGEHEGHQYFSMDFIEGRSLAEVIHDLRFTVYDFRRAARWVKIIAGAIQHAHERGIVHRDLKPSNILVDAAGEPHITDFGLAKQLVRTGSTPSQPGPGEVTDAVERLLTEDLTLTGQVLGSPGFAAPEQISGARLSSAAAPRLPQAASEVESQPASPAEARREPRVPLTRSVDIYGLGAILYYLLTGRPPFVGTSLANILRAVQENEPVAPRLLNAEVPADLETICLKCLAKEPAKRYDTAQALADELNRFLHDEPIQARPTSRVEKAWRWCRRKPALAASLAALALALTLGFIGVLTQWQRAERQKVRAEDNAANERRERYYASIAAADSHIRNGDIDVALNVLTNCPPELRHWEWGRLLYLCHQSISTVPLPTNYGEPLIVSGDGSRVAFFRSGRGTQAHCWDIRDQRELVRFGSDSNAVFTMAFSPDGKRIAMARLNGLVKIWDANTGQEQTEFSATSRVHSLQFNGDGTRLSVTTADHRGSLWDSATGRLLLMTPAADGPLRGVALDPTGRHWATMSDTGAISLRDAVTGRPRFIVQGYVDLNPLGTFTPTLLFSPDGKRILAHALADVAKVWNVEDGREVALIPSRVYDAAFSPDGRRVAIFSGNKTAEVWDLTTSKKALTLHGHRAVIVAIAYNADGERIVTASSDGTVRTWNADFGRELLSHPFHTDSVEFSPDGRRLITTQFDGRVRVWEIASGREVLAFRGNWNWARAASFSLDGKRIVTGGADRLARIIDADTGRELLVLKGHTSAVRAAAFSPDGRKVATASYDKTARLWDADTGRELYTLAAHTEPVRSLAFTPDGKKLITGGHDARAHVWETDTGRHLFSLAEGSAFSLAVSPDGKRIATGSMGKSIRIWDSRTGQKLAKWSTRDQVQRLDFSPDGKRLIVAASDNYAVRAIPSVEVWDTETGRQVLAFQGHPTLILGLKCSPDGRQLATSCFDGSVRLWETFPWEERFYPDPQAAILPTQSLLHPMEERDRERRPVSNSPLLNPLPTRSSRGEEALPRSTPFLERVKAYASEYWRERLAAESSRRSNEADTAPTNTPPVRLVTSAATHSPRFPRSAWPARDPGLSTNLIDLTAHYNALLNVPWRLILTEGDYDQDLSNLPTGAVTLSNVTFDVRGLIRLDGAERIYPYEGPRNFFASAVNGIAINAVFRRFHLFHGAEGSVPDGTVLCQYVLHYADGATREIPVLYGRDVRDWWQKDDDTKPETDRGIVVWRGTNRPVQQRGGQLRLYLSTLDNPRPEVEVKTIDLTSGMTPCVPFLVALTIEP